MEAISLWIVFGLDLCIAVIQLQLVDLFGGLYLFFLGITSSSVLKEINGGICLAGFVPIEEFVDETSEGPASTSSAKPSPAANWATQGGSALDDTFSSPTTGGKSAEVEEELSVPEPPPADAAHHANGEGPTRNGVDILVDEVSTAKSDGDGKSGRTTSASKASERCELMIK